MVETSATRYAYFNEDNTAEAQQQWPWVRKTLPIDDISMTKLNWISFKRTSKAENMKFYSLLLTKATPLSISRVSFFFYYRCNSLHKDYCTYWCNIFFIRLNSHLASFDFPKPHRLSTSSKEHRSIRYLWIPLNVCYWKMARHGKPKHYIHFIWFGKLKWPKGLNLSCTWLPDITTKGDCPPEKEQKRKFEQDS